jgi:hypothetical protein
MLGGAIFFTSLVIGPTLNKYIWGDIPGPMIALVLAFISIIVMSLLHDRQLRSGRRRPPK